ncbi:hypothetical protein ACYZTX_05870 [Pseudomonas sp. MDT1-17]
MSDHFLTEEFATLTTNISKLIQYKRHAERIFTEQHQKIQETHDKLPEWSINKQDGHPFHLFYRSPSSGVDITISSARQKLEDELEINTLLRLKTYQWLLVDAYEAFEVFLVNAYAHCGRTGTGIWEKPSNWKYRTGSMDINHYKVGYKPFTQLEAFRKNSAHFAQYETNSPTGTNYKVVFALIEKFRQCTVHYGGYSKNLNQLTSNVQDSLKDEDRDAVGEYVNSHFIQHGKYNLIDIFEAPAFDEDGTPNGNHQDFASYYLTVLVEYAQLITESIEAYPAPINS